MSTRLLRLPEVRARVPYSRATIYKKIQQGEFPAPIPLGARAVAWDSEAIEAFIASRIAAAKKKDGEQE